MSNDLQNESSDNDNDEELIDDEELGGMDMSRSPESTDSEIDEKSEGLRTTINMIPMSTSVNVNAPDSTCIEPAAADNSSDEIKVD